MPAAIGKIPAGPSTEPMRLVVTPSIDHTRLLRQESFAASYRSAEIICPDGLPILLYARLRGSPLRARVTGCALFRTLATDPAFAAKRTFIVVESRATEAAARRWAAAQGLANVSMFTAPPALHADLGAQAKLVQAVRAACPDILILTLGAPVSEVFLFRHQHDLPPCWALCVGQAVRVHLGLAKPAPKPWQSAGLEWLWRLIQEPRRLSGRYARAAAWFPVAVFRDILRQESKQFFFEKKNQKTFIH